METKKYTSDDNAEDPPPLGHDVHVLSHDPVHHLLTVSHMATMLLITHLTASRHPIHYDGNNKKLCFSRITDTHPC